MRKRIATVLVGLAAAAALTLASAAPAAANTWPGADRHGVVGTNEVTPCC